MTGGGISGKRNDDTATATPAGKKPRWDAVAMVATPPPPMAVTRKGKHFSAEQLRMVQKTNMVAVRILENKVDRQMRDLEEGIVDGITDELSNHCNTVDKLVKAVKELEERVAELEEKNQEGMVRTQAAAAAAAAAPTAAPLTQEQIRSTGLYKTLKCVMENKKSIETLITRYVQRGSTLFTDIYSNPVPLTACPSSPFASYIFEFPWKFGYRVMNRKRQNFHMCLMQFLNDKLKITCQKHIDLVKPVISEWFLERLRKIFNNMKSRFRNRLTTRGEPNKSWEKAIQNRKCLTLHAPS